MTGSALDNSAGSVRLIVVWGEARDMDAFESDYFGRHLPFVRQLPKLRSLTVSAVSSPRRSRFVELGFDTSEDVRDALSSLSGRRVVQDANELASKHGCTQQSFEVSDLLLSERGIVRNG